MLMAGSSDPPVTVLEPPQLMLARYPKGVASILIRFHRSYIESSLPSIDGTNVFPLSLSTLPIQPLPSLCAAEQYHSCRNRTLLVAASTRPPLLTVIPLMPIVWTRPSTGTPNLTRSSGLPSIQVLTGVHHCFVLRPTPRVFPDSLTSPRMPISTTALVSHCCDYAKACRPTNNALSFCCWLT